MRLVLISDTHGLHNRLGPLPEGDILVHAGDFMNAGFFRSVMSTNTKRIALLFVCAASSFLAAQTQTPVDVWTLQADITPGGRYFGETVANGMLGLVAAPDPFSTGAVMMQGLFDRSPENVDVILRTFNVVHMALAIDNTGIAQSQQVTHLHQALSLRRAAMTTTFDYQDKASV